MKAPTSAFRLALPERLGPAGAGLLPASGDGERVRFDVLGDDRARTDIGAVADPDRRDEGGIRPDEGARADVGLVLAVAVVVAGDRPRADVRARADAGVADVGQVVDLGPLLDGGVLDLDEVADLGLR